MRPTPRPAILRLRRRSFDAAVIFTVYSQSPLPAALLCHLAAIPLRAAFCHENPYQLLTDWVRDPEPALERHEVERQLALVTELGFSPADASVLRGTVTVGNPMRSGETYHVRMRVWDKNKFDNEITAEVDIAVQ